MNATDASLPVASLPVVIVPVGTDEDALDACLAALDAGTPAGSRIWLADDAQSGPRGSAIIERWLQRTSLQADYTRRQNMIGEVAHLDEMLKACAGADVVVLDIEDGLPAAQRPAGRLAVVEWLNTGAQGWVRINSVSNISKHCC